MKLKHFFMTALVPVVLVQASLTSASPGIAGDSGKSGSDFNASLSEGAIPTVTISGSATVTPDSENSCPLTITGDPLAAGACDIAASGGTLGAGTGDSLKNSETVGGPTTSASYTEGAVTKIASSSVAIAPAGATAAALAGLAVQGSASVSGGSTATYTAQASFTDGSFKNVTAKWSVTPATYASVNSSGVLTANKVTANQSVKVSASYTQSGVTKTAFLDVIVTGGANPTIGSVNNSGVIVLASNDLGMHCVCPSFSKFMVLPPYNTIRAQVLRKGGEDPRVLGPSSGIKVAYSIAENTDASLSADPYYKDWMTNAPKLGFKAYPVKDANGHIQSPITGTKLSGYMTAKSPGWWEAVGVPVYPDVSSLSTAKPLVDPLGGPNRNPYLTGNIQVYNSSNTLLAQTQHHGAHRLWRVLQLPSEGSDAVGLSRHGSGIF